MSQRIRRFVFLAFVFLILESSLFPGGADYASAAALGFGGADQNAAERADRAALPEGNGGSASAGIKSAGSENAGSGNVEDEGIERDGTDSEDGGNRDADGREDGNGTEGSEADQWTDDGAEKRTETEVKTGERRIVEILGIDKENLMEFEAGTVTIEEALAMLPTAADVKLESGDIVNVGIKWNYEYCSARTERFRLALDSGEYILGLPVGELPYVDILLDGVHTLEAYAPNTSSTVKLDKSLGCTKDVVTYLKSHQATYLGTPYSHLGTGLTAANCMVPGKSGSMNCTGFVAHVLKACGADLNKIPKRLPGHYLNASNWNDYAHNYGIQSYRFDSISAALKSGKLEKGDVIYFEPKLWAEGDDCHIGFFWGDTPSQNQFWHSDYKGNRISEIVAKTSNSYVYLFKVEHEPQTGYLKLHKASAFSDMTSDNSCYSLEGAVYTVYNTNKNGALSGKVGELKTAKNGDTSVLELALGTYYIKETAAPRGFESDEKIYAVEVTAAATKESPVFVKVQDRPGYTSGGITITKIADGERTSCFPTLEGTEFTIQYYDGYYSKETLPASAKRTWVIRTKKLTSGICAAELNDTCLVKELSDELYYCDKAPVLPYGTISIQETKPAAGYTLKGYLVDANGRRVATDGERYISQITKGEDGVALDGGNAYAASDQPILGSIRIRKYDTDGTSPLKGVTFELVNRKGEVVAAGTTDRDGEILFENLRPDVYTIRETKTAEGHSLLKEVITAEIPMRVTEKEIADNEIDKSQCIYDEADDIYYIYDLTYEISNDVSLDMPMTGGGYTVWTWLPMIAGLLVFGMAGTLVIRRKRGIFLVGDGKRHRI